MQFTRIPTQFSPLGGRIDYAVGHPAAATVLIRITDADGTLRGAKRFAAVQQAAFDAAPYLRSALRFTPAAGPTGVFPATGRTVTAVVEATVEVAADATEVSDETVRIKTTADKAAAAEKSEDAASGAATAESAKVSDETDRNGTTANKVTAAEIAPSETAVPSEMTASCEAAASGTTVREAAAARAAVDGAGVPLQPLTATAPARTFLPSAEAVAAPGMLTTMPAVRLLPDGACDELTLLTAAAQSVTVIARNAETTTAVNYSVPGPGVYLFRLDARDFPGAETLTVDAGACGSVSYTRVAAPCDGVRLAWRSSAGSVEHYTFPVEVSAVVEATKSRAYGPDGRTAAGTLERRRTLRSAFEVRPVLEALSELTATPDVWLVTPTGYKPVDVVSEQAVVHRHGTLSCLEIAVRPRCKTPLPWS
ncbi:hypothetical protein [Alistipes sp.]|uniref:hypothetical protein n=1 Tax=Alistipes sp. TaxID=1872444 RepID=UPI003AF1A008